MHTLKKNFDVSMIFNDGSVNKSVTYNVSVKTIESLIRGGYLISVTTNEFLVDNKAPDLVMEQLAEKCRKPIETIVFYVSDAGQVTDIYNYNEIIFKWEQAKERLELEYTGEVFLKYVNACSSVIYSKDVLLSKLKKDLFIGQFFCRLYNTPFVAATRRDVEDIKFFGIDYEANVIYKFEYDEDNNGFIKKELDVAKNEISGMPIDGYNVKYKLSDDLSIKGIEGKFKNHYKSFNFIITEIIS